MAPDKNDLLLCHRRICPPRRGRVMLGDKDISHYPIHRRARHGLSYLPQESSIFTGLTAEENILAVLEIKGVAGKEKRLLTQKLLEDMGLEHLADVNALAFSGGERRKVEIARLLAGNPDFVLLDEPFAAIELSGGFTKNHLRTAR